jgi:hypothetical protein
MFVLSLVSIVKKKFHKVGDCLIWLCVELAKYYMIKVLRAPKTVQ